MAPAAPSPRSALKFALAASYAAQRGSSATPPDATADPRAVYSIGDLHGDFDRCRLILQGAGLASFDGESPTWTGGTSILVSTGDSVDRGSRSRPIYQAFAALARQAAQHGGEVVSLLGNHDLMNVQDDLRYVPAEEMAAEGDYRGEEGRRWDFSPEGPIGRDLRERYEVAVVRERVLFVHAGLHPRWLAGGATLEEMNARARELLAERRVTEDEPLFGPDGPLWDRTFALDSEDDCCPLAEETLRLVGADRMVVGHTPQDLGVGVRCSGGPAGPRVILADTAISRAYGDCGVASVIEYKGNDTTAIYFWDFETAAYNEAQGGPTFERRPIFTANGEAESPLGGSRCVDFPGWTDCSGNGCWLYELNPEWCQLYGTQCATCGRHAVDACCACRAATVTSAATAAARRPTPAERQAILRSKEGLRTRIAAARAEEAETERQAAEKRHLLNQRSRSKGLLKAPATPTPAENPVALRAGEPRATWAPRLASAISPKAGSRQAACSAHAACNSLAGDCCPTSGGVVLDCCSAGVVV